MTGKRALAILLTALWGCLAFLGGCAPQAGGAASTQVTPTPGPQPAVDPASLPSGQDLDVPWTQEGILVELAGYTDEEDGWAMLYDQYQITLLEVTPEIEVVGGPLKEGQRVAVTCLAVLETYPSIFSQVSKVEVLGELSPEEWEEAPAKVDEIEQDLRKSAEFVEEMETELSQEE